MQLSRHGWTLHGLCVSLDCFEQCQIDMFVIWWLAQLSTMQNALNLPCPAPRLQVCL